MREIGGYLELENFKGEEYYPNLIALNTGRNALEYLIRARKINKVYLPYYLCDSVSGVCDRCGCNYEYYHIREDFRPDFAGGLDDGEWLYIVNYFGQISNEEIIRYKRQYGNIIFDNVQAFFQKPVEGIDTIYSCRKFFGVPDGAYLATDAPEIELETDVSMDRMRHILGRYEGKSASDYYADFAANDESFTELPLRKMSRLTHNILRAIDYESVKKTRTENWNILHNALGNKNKLRLQDDMEGPYMYPFLTEMDGTIIRRCLIEQKIFIPKLWPNVTEFSECELENHFTKDIIPLPVDQRYDVDDIENIIDHIKNII